MYGSTKKTLKGTFDIMGFQLHEEKNYLNVRNWVIDVVFLQMYMQPPVGLVLYFEMTPVRTD